MAIVLVHAIINMILITGRNLNKIGKIKSRSILMRFVVHVLWWLSLHVLQLCGKMERITIWDTKKTTLLKVFFRMVFSVPTYKSKLP